MTDKIKKLKIQLASAANQEQGEASLRERIDTLNALAYELRDNGSE